MLSLPQARKRALHTLNRGRKREDRMGLVSEEEKPYGWIFSYDSQRFIDTGNHEYCLIGNGPLLVEKISGEVIFFSSEPAAFLAELRDHERRLMQPPVPVRQRPEAESRSTSRADGRKKRFFSSTCRHCGAILNLGIRGMGDSDPPGVFFWLLILTLVLLKPAYHYNGALLVLMLIAVLFILSALVTAWSDAVTRQGGHNKGSCSRCGGENRIWPWSL